MIVPVSALVTAVLLVVKKKSQIEKNHDETNDDKYISLNQ